MPVAAAKRHPVPSVACRSTAALPPLEPYHSINLPPLKQNSSPPNLHTSTLQHRAYGQARDPLMAIAGRRLMTFRDNAGGDQLNRCPNTEMNDGECRRGQHRSLPESERCWGSCSWATPPGFPSVLGFGHRVWARGARRGGSIRRLPPTFQPLSGARGRGGVWGPCGRGGSRTEARGQQKQSNDPGNNQHILNTPTIGRR